VQRGPYTLPEILEGLNAQRDHAQIDLEELVRKRGVTFECTPELAKVLRDFGASDGLLARIPSKPLPPPPPISGSLTIRCGPVDCEVVVNDRYYGATRNGATTIPGLPTGSTTIAVFRDGFENASRAIELTENQSSDQTFALKPSHAQQELAAQRMFAAVVSSLGGFSGIDELQSFTLAGTLELETSGNKSGSMKMSIGPAAEGRTLSLQSDAGIRCSVLLFGKSVPECKGRKGAPEPQVSLAAELWRRSTFPAVLSVFLNSNLMMAQSQESTVLNISSATESSSLTLDDQHRPIEFNRRSTETSPVIEQVQFAEYAEYKGALYPRKVVVTRPAPDPVSAKFSLEVQTAPSSHKRK
jgi:hypothetical protein